MIEVQRVQGRIYFRVMINDKNFGNYSIMNKTQPIRYLKFMSGNRSNYLTNYALININDVNLTANTEALTPYPEFGTV